jgi:hypothetical protein
MGGHFIWRKASKPCRFLTYLKQPEIGQQVKKD